MEHQRPRPRTSKFVREVRRIGRNAQKLIRPLLPGRRSRQQGVDLNLLRDTYAHSPLAAEPDTFCLLRIIGNDLVPRHSKGQSRENVAFILEHEPAFEGCTKAWVLNRIFDAEEEAAIIKLLDDHGQTYHRIPFELAAYARQAWEIDALPEPALKLLNSSDETDARERLRLATLIRRSKSNYAINNNGARNAALTLGRTRAKWVLPWDGNCFVTHSAWTGIRTGIAEKPYLPYFIVPMVRITDNAALLRQDFKPGARDEPQIIFRRDAKEMFDERFPYGHRPKVELLYRLGVPDVWDDFEAKEFELPRPPLCSDAGQVGTAGWVARLNSGNPALEVGHKNGSRRGVARDEAIVAFLDMLDRASAEANLMPSEELSPPRQATAQSSP
jgi:hypothetical protein